jgi:DNA polymerase
MQPLSGELATMDWAALQQAVANCQACGLCKSRKNTVFGVGDTQARWLVVGEAPGENEDLQGEPFVGQAGRLLDNMLKAVGLSRSGTGEQAVYIANVLKCRPPANRNPLPEEMLKCAPFLQRQVELLQPRVILALGRFAAQSLLQATVPNVAATPLGKLRGQVHQYLGVPVIVSYHPAYLLRTPQDKAKAWADLCLALDVAKRT